MCRMHNNTEFFITPSKRREERTSMSRRDVSLESNNPNHMGNTSELRARGRTGTYCNPQAAWYWQIHTHLPLTTHITNTHTYTDTHIIIIECILLLIKRYKNVCTHWNAQLVAVLQKLFCRMQALFLKKSLSFHFVLKNLKSHSFCKDSFIRLPLEKLFLPDEN